MTTFIESQLNNEESNGLQSQQDSPRNLLKHHLIFSRKLIILTLCLFLAILLPFLIYLTVFDKITPSRNTGNECTVDKIYQIPCGNNVTEEECWKIFCCFDTYTNSCFHQEPSRYYYQQDTAGTFIPSLNETPLGLPSLKKLQFNVIEDSDKLRIIINDDQSIGTKNLSSFNVTLEEKKLALTVFRQNTSDLLLTTLKGPLIASDEYLEWNIQLTNTSGVLFGLGDLAISLDENSTFTKIIYKNRNNHNTLPIFMANNHGKYHAVQILHEGALQVTVLPSYMILLKNVYGGKIEIDVIDGPTPKEIYRKIRMETKTTIKNWALGVHLCREDPVESLDAIVEQYDLFVERKKNFPEFSYESDCIHDDLLLHLLEAKYDASNVGEFFERLSMTQKFMLSFPPQIPINSLIFEKYSKLNLFYMNQTNEKVYLGIYKGMEVAYPNYQHINISDFLTDIRNLFAKTDYMGLVYSNSWPEDESYKITRSKQPFMNKEIEEALSETLPWNLKDEGNLHIRYHNNYGRIAQQTVDSYFSKQEISLSPVSSLASHGPLIVQNINASWTQMRQSLRSTLYNSLFGNDLLSVPVCGSNEFYDKKVNEDLCMRWYILASTMPLLRISSKGTSRDPTNLNTMYTANKAIKALNLRKSLLQYFRTLLMDEQPVVRPMFYNFPEDENVLALDSQYMIGDAVLVAHPMSPDIRELNIYLPPSRVWYEIWGGMRYVSKKGEEWIKFPIVPTDWIGFIQEGHILPQVLENKTGYDLKLTVALKCSKTCSAKGGLTLHFNSDNEDVAVNFLASDDEIKVEANKDRIDEIKKMIKKVCFFSYDKNWCDASPQKYIRG